MSIIETESAFVAQTAASLSLSQMFTVAASASNPTYLVLTALDRNEYTAGASRATGTLSGNGHTLSLSSLGGDGRGAGIVFTYQSSSGRYYNSTYGYLDQLTYNASASLNDVTDLSLFGTNSSSIATLYGSNPELMMQVDPSGYLGSVTVATQPRFTGTVPAQATPNSIAAVANSFVGQAWNMEGCWVLASTIAAEAGASLPEQSTLVGIAGQASDEWIVAFNGPAGQSGNWQALVHTGEVIVFGTPGGGGHVTTCVSGSGSTAMLVDNITYVNGSGQVQNGANDGSSADVLIAAPHAASQEWSGVSASSVVIYELDTPIVTASVATDSLAFLASQSIGSLFSAVDPANKSITQWQVYDTATTDALVVGSVHNADHSAATSLTVTTLGSVSLLAGSTATTDTLEVRAYNGTYWGDWTSLNVTIAAVVAAAAPSPAPPVLAAQTAAQSWIGGRSVTLVLPTGTFTDPQNQTLTYTAKLSTGQPLPSWLSFNATTGTFTGTPPAAMQSFSVVVTAKDTSGLSATDTFGVTVVGPPVVTAATPNQTWTEGAAISLALPAGTFTDPQRQALTYKATLANGQALPSWLTFNGTTDTFTGTAPATAQTLSLTVTATDTSGLSASETFSAAVVAPAPPVVHPGIAVTAQTPAQTWTDGTSATLVLPANTFTDALGLKMSFAAYQIAGANATSWLHFNSTTDTLYGAVPTNATGTIGIAIIASDAQHVSATDLFTLTFVPPATHGATAVGASFLPVADPGLTSSLLAFHT
jgi:hypothetical protein